MPSLIDKIDRYHKTPKGHILFGAGELIISYAVLARSIDSGNLLLYVLFILLLLGGINNLVKGIFKRFKKGGAKTK